MGALSYEPEYVVEGILETSIVLDDLAISSQEILEGNSKKMIDELLRKDRICLQFNGKRCRARYAKNSTITRRKR